MFDYPSGQWMPTIFLPGQGPEVVKQNGFFCNLAAEV
jgi:hypothetical protein